VVSNLAAVARAAVVERRVAPTAAEPLFERQLAVAELLLAVLARPVAAAPSATARLVAVGPAAVEAQEVADSLVVRVPEAELDLHRRRAEYSCRQKLAADSPR